MKIDTRKVEDLLTKGWEIIIEDEDNPTRGKAKPRLKPPVNKLPRAIRIRNQFLLRNSQKHRLHMQSKTLTSASKVLLNLGAHRKKSHEL